MWSPSSGLPRRLGRVALAGLVAALPLLSACQVRPLYSSAAMVSGTDTFADLSTVAIKPVKTRYAQEVRNHLIFLINGGSGEPAQTRYSMELAVTRLVETAAVVQIANENEPSAATVTLTATYVITDNDIPSGDKVSNVVLTGSRQISSSFDVPRQEFAAVRAERDAENRAARELAELLRLAVAQQLQRLPAPVAQVSK